MKVNAPPSVLRLQKRYEPKGFIAELTAAESQREPRISVPLFDTEVSLARGSIPPIVLCQVRLHDTSTSVTSHITLKLIDVALSYGIPHSTKLSPCRKINR